MSGSGPTQMNKPVTPSSAAPIIGVDEFLAMVREKFSSASHRRS